MGFWLNRDAFLKKAEVVKKTVVDSFGSYQQKMLLPLKASHLVAQII
jgi:hypothetical protein